MSAVDNLLAERCEALSNENDRLNHQNKRLAHLLADALDSLTKFQREAQDTLRHFGCQRKASGKFDWRKLVDR